MTPNTWTIIFDLDGVLADIKEIHYQALNNALQDVTGSSTYNIDKDAHFSQYDGLKTYDKLALLTKEKGLDPAVHQAVWDRKQQLTQQLLDRLPACPALHELMISLRQAGHRLAVCSNSIRDTCYIVLSNLGVFPYLSLVLSNDDVVNPKPHPSIYWKAMSMLNSHPDRTLIVEDSPAGLEAAHHSGAKVLQIQNSKDLSLRKIQAAIGQSPAPSARWRQPMNIVIPMGGAGRRFAEKGYSFPKPLIEIEGKPMIQLVLENLRLDGRYIFIVDPPTLKNYNLETMLNILAPGCVVIPEEGQRQGAAYATLLAEQYIDNDQPLIIANCDQLVEWNPLQFMYKAQEQGVDGSILTFESVHPKWSYAKTNEFGIVTEVAEKNPISNQANVGIFLWRRGKDYVRCLKKMVDKNVRVNGEFYVCPVFNEGIEEGLKFSTYRVDKMCGIGDPESLEEYLNRVR